MATMKNILVLTDFSQNGRSAEEYALQLAIKTHANLVLYNAYPNQSVKQPDGNVVWPHDKSISLQLQSISNLEARVSELKDELNLIKADIYEPSISHLGDEGTVTDRLNELIEKNNIWLVIMGTKGEGFANTVIFGSNVFKVLNTINHPVLVIPQNAVFKDLQKIAYVTDLRSTDLFIIEWLHELSGILQAELLIANVSSDELSNQQNDLSKNATEKMYQSQFPKTHIKSFHGKYIKDSLHEITEQMDVDIISLMHRKYGFFHNLFHESTSYEMVKHTKIPVLIFPDSE